MAHSTQAKKNKHANKHKSFQHYLYKNHIPTHHSKEQISAKTRAELDENIVMMRRRLRQTIRKLQNEYRSDSEEPSESFAYHKGRIRPLSY